MTLSAFSFINFLLVGRLVIIGFLLSLSIVESSYLRIIEGRDASDDEYPFVVQLESQITTYILENNITTTEIETQTFCSAAALSATWTLTAAQCASELDDKRNKEKNDKLRIRYSYHPGNPRDEDKFSEVLRYIVPTLSRALAVSYYSADIALLETDPIMIDRFAKISALDYASLYGHEVVLVGYGETKEGDTVKLPIHLNKPMQVVDKAMLKPCDKNGYPIVCVARPCNKQFLTCSGDTGAPVLHPSGVIGVLSQRESAIDCHKLRDNRIRNDDDTIITPISPFLDWLTDVTSATTSERKENRKI